MEVLLRCFPFIKGTFVELDHLPFDNLHLIARALSFFWFIIPNISSFP